MPAGLSLRIAMIVLLASLAPGIASAQEQPAAAVEVEAVPAQSGTSEPDAAPVSLEAAPAATPAALPSSATEGGAAATPSSDGTAPATSASTSDDAVPPATGGPEAGTMQGSPETVRVDDVPATTVESGMVENAEPAEPAPSFMEDPAGAISHLMTQAERDPNLPHDLSPWGMFVGPRQRAKEVAATSA